MLFSTPPHTHPHAHPHTHTGLILYMSMDDALQMQMQGRFEQVSCLEKSNLHPPPTDGAPRSIQVFQLGNCCNIAPSMSGQRNSLLLFGPSCIIDSISCPASCIHMNMRQSVSTSERLIHPFGFRSTACKGKLLSTHALTDQATTAGSNRASMF